jgi:DNA gyrase/topoisomerase IV subunit A
MSRRDRHSAQVDPDQEWARDRRLELLEALLAALDRREEVSDVVSASKDPDEAVERIQELLRVSPVAAVEILNMQWRRFTRADRQEIQSRIEELRSRA